jgi:hypothetical protein
MMSLTPPLQSKLRKKAAIVASKDDPGTVYLINVVSFLMDICGFNQDVPKTLAKFRVISFGNLFTSLYDDYLVKWFNKVPQLPSSCSLQGVFITS